jgi:hypothetical protein
MSGINNANNKRIYDLWQPQPDAMNIEFTNIRIEDSL